MQTTRFGGVPTLVWLMLMSGVLAGSVRAAGSQDPDGDGPDRLRYTAASLRATMLYAQATTAHRGGSGVAASRSVPLAFGLSALVPGLGQAYNGQWIKAAIAAGLEVALVAGYATWRNKGLDGRDAYQVYAHTSWSPIRYADWLNDYMVYLETEFGTRVDAMPIELTSAIRGIDVTNPGGWTTDEQHLVRDLITQIRAVESEVYHPETGATFSHKLPFFGEQQYYELVGKYFQFAPGWEDYVALEDENGNVTWIDSEGNFIATIDPELTGPDGSKPNVSATFFDYAEDHGRANDYLRNASRLSLLFVVNHLIAAVDAAVFARLHNNRLQARLQMEYVPAGSWQPMASLRVRL